MKKIIILFLVLCGAGLGTSCDDFLTEHPSTQFSPEDVYSSPNGVQAVLNSCYGYISQSNGYGGYLHMLLSWHTPTMQLQNRQLDLHGRAGDDERGGGQQHGRLRLRRSLPDDQYGQRPADEHRIVQRHVGSRTQPDRRRSAAAAGALLLQPRAHLRRAAVYRPARRLHRGEPQAPARRSTGFTV